MRKVLVLDGDQIVTAYNHPDRGSATAIIASLLMNIDTDEIYVTGLGLFPFLAGLNNQWQYSVPGWIMRFSDKKRRVPIEKKDGKIGYTGHFFVDYFAIDERNVNINGKNRNKFRKRITVINLELFFNKPPVDYEQQLEAALALFHVADSRGIKIRNSNGALGAALLRTMPSWKVEKRHAAPKFVNLLAKDHLPGNLYSLSEKYHDRIPSGYHIDQEGSYHAITKSIRIPHPHSIRARGYYKEALSWNEKESLDTKDGRWKVWTKEGDQVFDEIISGRQMGLFLARIYIDTLGRYDKHLYPPWARRSGKKYVWLWSPEFRFIQADKRLHLDSIMAAFSGFVGDPAITQYGTWALDYLQNNSWAKPHTKGALHAAYGMLAYNTKDKPKIRKYWGGRVRGNSVELPSAGIVQERQFDLKDTYQTS